MMNRLVSIPAFLLLVGCVQQPSGEMAPQCEVTADCDVGDGEICDEGICWGGPPESVSFAAILSPPAERDDLALTEIPLLPIATDGTIDAFEFGPSVVISGRVILACMDGDMPAGCGPERSIAARLTFERTSRIPGGPSFKHSVEASAGAGPDDEPAFRVRLPALGPGERYDITVAPSAVTSETAVNPAEIAPPARFTLDSASETSNLLYAVGSPAALKRIEGRVRTEFSEVGDGVGGMQVQARGQWAADQPVTRASNLAITRDDGTFVLWVPLAMEDTFEIVARPTGELVAPTLTRTEVIIPDPVMPGDIAVLPDFVLPPLPNPAPFVVTIAGTSPSGEETKVAGAQVSATTALAPAASDLLSVATYTVAGATSAEGTLELLMYPGGSNEDTRQYTLRVLPPQESLSAALYARTVEVAGVPTSGRGFLQKIVLNPRIAVSGTVVDANGTAIADTSVTVSASPLFRDTLAPSEQQVLDGLAFPSALSNGDGGFVVWVDPAVDASPAVYDLELVPPADAGAPRWSQDAVQAGSAGPGEPINLGTVELPPALWARGLVHAGGQLVPGAEVRIVEIPAVDLGAQLGYADDGCAPRAKLRGIWRSGDDGRAVLVLPDAEDR